MVVIQIGVAPGEAAAQTLISAHTADGLEANVAYQATWEALSKDHASLSDPAAITEILERRLCRIVTAEPMHATAWRCRC